MLLMPSDPFQIGSRKIKLFTNGFSEDNFIGNFQFGKVYRGIWKAGVGKDFGRKEGDMEVVVKIWEDPLIYKVCPGDTKERLRDEIRLVERLCRYGYHHPNLAKMIAYKTFGDFCCCIYDIRPLDTLHNLIQKESFSWLQRTKVAFGFASALEYLHFLVDSSPWMQNGVPYLVRNIDAAHIMVDKDQNPILFDFSMVSGGQLTDKKDLLNQYVDGCYGYIDPSLAQCGWSDKSDVFAYGVVLLGLIMKRVYTDEDRTNHLPFVYELANDKYKSENNSSLVHQSLEAEPFFESRDGILLTELAMQCVDYDPQKRPSMTQVVKSLRKLCIGGHHADAFYINEYIRSGNEEDVKKPELSEELFRCYFQYEKIINKGQSRPTNSISGKDCDDDMMIHSLEDLSFYTNGFSEENLIGNFQFGKVYLGEMEGRKVTVKLWDKVKIRRNSEVFDSEMEVLLRKELVLLRHPKLMLHPNLVKLIGYCHQDKSVGVVYDLKPFNTIHNLLLNDTFTWSKRIKVALEFACLLKFLHDFDQPYLVRNISATNIMLDQEYNPKLFDLGMFTGGILRYYQSRFERHPSLRWELSVGCDGYTDLDNRDEWGEDYDVFSFGILLVALIAKKVTGKEELKRGEPPLHEWLQSECAAKMLIPGFDKSKFSVVHESLEKDPAFCSSDGVALTKLALQCFVSTDKIFHARPSMKHVVMMLARLQIVRKQKLQ